MSVTARITAPADASRPSLEIEMSTGNPITRTALAIAAVIAVSMLRASSPDGISPRAPSTPRAPAKMARTTAVETVPATVMTKKACRPHPAATATTVSSRRINASTTRRAEKTPHRPSPDSTPPSPA